MRSIERIETPSTIALMIVICLPEREDVSHRLNVHHKSGPCKDFSYTERVLEFFYDRDEAEDGSATKAESPREKPRP